MEFSESGADEGNQEVYQAGDTELPTVLSIYQGFVEPSSGTFALTPAHPSSEMTKKIFLTHSADEYLAYADTLGNTTLMGLASHFDDGSNKIWLFEGQGLTATNNESNDVSGMLARFTSFSDSNVIVGNGASSSGSDYVLNFGDVAQGNTSSRPFSLTNTTGSSYSFAIIMHGTVQSLSNPKYITSVSAINWTYPQSGNIMVTITGSGFSTAPTLLVAGQTIPTDSASNTVITATISSAITAGQLQVVRNDDSAIDGPYIIQPSAIHANVTLPAGLGTLTRKFWWRVQSSPAPCSTLVGGCPNYNTDMEFLPNYSLTDAGATSTTMHYVSFSGQSCFYAGYDTSGNGRLGNGDRYRLVGAPTPLIAGQTHDWGNITLSSTITSAGNCP